MRSHLDTLDEPEFAGIISTDDFCKSMDGLAAIFWNEFDLDAFNGAVFILRSKPADRLKPIVWDGIGLIMTYKRIEGKGFR